MPYLFIIFIKIFSIYPGHTYTSETLRHFETRKGEHKTGKPIPTEVSLHHHDYKENNFKLILQTAHTKIGEAIIYDMIDVDKRLNANLPGFNLKLFKDRPPLL